MSFVKHIKTCKKGLTGAGVFDIILSVAARTAATILENDTARRLGTGRFPSCESNRLEQIEKFARIAESRLRERTVRFLRE